MTERALTSAPSLGSLYLRAAVRGSHKLHDNRGDVLPDSRYTLTDQRIDAEHLARYQRVCGFRVTDGLPPTYLHVLAFPVATALMSERAFPFPLVGLVHVANTITVLRPVRADASVSFAVHAENVRSHRAGRQFDMVVEANVDGEAVWSGRSTYLRRGGSKSDRPRADRPPGPDEPAVPTVQVRVPDGIGRRYAAVSGDRNPIHLHPLTAKAFGFPRAIAHGMWLAARTLATLEGRLPETLSYDLAFKTPVLLPSTVSIAAALTSDGWDLEVGNAKSAKPHLAGTVRTG